MSLGATVACKVAAERHVSNDGQTTNCVRQIDHLKTELACSFGLDPLRTVRSNHQKSPHLRSRLGSGMRSREWAPTSCPPSVHTMECAPERSRQDKPEAAGSKPYKVLAKYIRPPSLWFRKEQSLHRPLAFHFSVISRLKTGSTERCWDPVGESKPQKTLIPRPPPMLPKASRT